MSKAENIVMLKSGTSTQTRHSLADLRRHSKQKQIQAQHYQKNITNLRQQMKHLSVNITNLIHKQQKHPKQRPIVVLKPEYQSEKANSLWQEREAVHHEIDKLKDQIDDIKAQQQQALTNEILLRKSKLEHTQRKIDKLQNQKLLMYEKLDSNKEITDRLKNSFCLIEIQSSEKEYQETKRECKFYEKEIYQFSAEELIELNYINDLQYKTKQLPEQKQIVDESFKFQVEELVDQINRILTERDQVEKQKQDLIRGYKKEIYNQEKNIYELKLKIRQVQNSIYKVKMNQQREPSQPKKTLSQFKSQRKNQRHYQSTYKLEKIKPVQQPKKVYLMNKEEGNSIIIGEWQPQEELSRHVTDQSSFNPEEMDRVKMTTFYIGQDDLLGLRCVYQAGKLLQYGKDMLISSENEEVMNRSEVDVIFDEISVIQYGGKITDGKVYIKFIYHNGFSKVIGKKNPTQNYEIISLDNYIIKSIELIVDKKSQSSKLSAIKVSLGQKPEQKMGESEVTYKSQSQSNSQNHFKKRVVIKSLKKISQHPVDHRLLLNRNKV